MSKSAQQRMAENEVVFRRYNESVQKGFDEVRRIAVEDSQEHMVHETDVPLQFYCECADEDCRGRISLKPSAYNRIHKLRDRFIVLPSHEVNAIERIVSKKTGFHIVEKHIPFSSAAQFLKKTEINNT